MLYTVRSESAADLHGTLAAVAEMGYEGVELFDLHGHAPGQVRDWLDELGLVACGRHVPLAALESELPESGCAGSDPGLEPRRAQLDRATRVEGRGTLARRAPARDRRPGSCGSDSSSASTTTTVRYVPSRAARASSTSCSRCRVFLELDLGWVWWAGVDPSHCSSAHAAARRSCTSRISAPEGSARSARSVMAPSATSVSPRRRSRQVRSGFWSSRTRPTGRRSPPRGARSRRCARCWSGA